MNKYNLIDKIRTFYLLVGELLDTWRIIPRLIVFGYGWLVYKTFIWYLSLEPYVLENCNLPPEQFNNCIINAPTQAQSIVLGTIVGVASLIFNFYVKTGRDYKGWLETINDLKNRKGLKLNTNGENDEKSQLLVEKKES